MNYIYKNENYKFYYKKKKIININIVINSNLDENKDELLITSLICNIIKFSSFKNASDIGIINATDKTSSNIVMNRKQKIMIR